MPSSRRAGLATLVFAAALGLASSAGAQQAARGFAVERLSPAPPGGGWFVLDALDMRGALGGAFAVTGSYAKNPLRVTDGAKTLDVVSDEAIVDLGFAATYDRLRLSLDLPAPLAIGGESGTAGSVAFTAPSASLAHTPDTLLDARLGLDVRLLGGPRSPFRLGASAQLFVPVDVRADYDTDGTYRGVLRVLVAGDVGRWTYAGELGVHVRPLDDAATPGGPRGSELLFGVAAGARVHLWAGQDLLAGPEVFGETALRSFFGSGTTGVEGLMTARVEGTADDGLQARVKVGAGGGLDAEFGAPEWRVVVGVELFNHGSDRDGDGVGDKKDACPDKPGARTEDPKTDGCPLVPPL